MNWDVFKGNIYGWASYITMPKTLPGGLLSLVVTIPLNTHSEYKFVAIGVSKTLRTARVYSNRALRHAMSDLNIDPSNIDTVQIDNDEEFDRSDLDNIEALIWPILKRLEEGGALFP